MRFTQKMYGHLCKRLGESLRGITVGQLFSEGWEFYVTGWDGDLERPIIIHFFFTDVAICSQKAILSLKKIPAAPKSFADCEALMQLANDPA